MFWPVGSSFTSALPVPRYMLPLASSAKAVALKLARQMEKSMAVTDELNLVMNVQALVVGVPRVVDVTGKSGDVVPPATYAAPVESTATPTTPSLYEPPK